MYTSNLLHVISSRPKSLQGRQMRVTRRNIVNEDLSQERTRTIMYSHGAQCAPCPRHITWKRTPSHFKHKTCTSWYTYLSQVLVNVCTKFHLRQASITGSIRPNIICHRVHNSLVDQGLDCRALQALPTATNVSEMCVYSLLLLLWHRHEKVNILTSLTVSGDTSAFTKLKQLFTPKYETRG